MIHSQISIVTAGLLFQSQQFDINSSHTFLLKNVSMSTFSAVCLLRLELIMLPDVLNTRSDATLVAAIVTLHSISRFDIGLKLNILSQAQQICMAFYFS